jgi:hypothetical protein
MDTVKKEFELTPDAAKFMESIAGLSQEKRDHMRMLVELLIVCYTDPSRRAVCVFDSDRVDSLALVTVNSNEMEATSMLQRLLEHLLEHQMDDAPPKEMMN